MNIQRKLLLGFSLMALPAFLIGVAAVRATMLQRRALDTLGENMARNRTYSELENAVSTEGEVVWRYLTGMDPTARQEFQLNREVVEYWLGRWKGELRPNEAPLAGGVEAAQRQLVTIADSVFTLYDGGKHEAAYQLAQVELRDRLEPAFAALNRDIYRHARESSVQGAYRRLEEILAGESRALLALLVLALGTAVVASWYITRTLVRPISELRSGMALVGAGELERPINATSGDEIGDLSRAFAQMTDALRASHTDLVRLNGELEAKVRQLERTQAQLVQSERLASIGEMSAAVAHGIRNPLASLRAAAQLAMRRTDAKGSREQLESIIYEVDRLDRRVGHLLSFSRPAPFHPGPERVDRLLDDLRVTFTKLCAGRQVDLVVSVAPETPEVSVDSGQIEQALVELVSNALDAMPTGGHLQISARSETSPDGNPGVRIEVADSGAGIPDAVLASVCEPFFTTRPEGTGLGLATAKRFVEQNGGHLEITSRRDVGTSVGVWLPVEATALVGTTLAAPPERAGIA